jgi:hypothetical protein
VNALSLSLFVCLFLLGRLFYSAVSIWAMLSVGKFMNDESEGIWKETGVAQLRYCSGIRLE